MKSLRVYRDLCEVVSDFKRHYELDHSLRKIDHFLWAYGKEFLRTRKEGEKPKRPTNKLVDEWVEKLENDPKYEKYGKDSDDALKKLINCFPANTNVGNVCVKVAVVKTFYGVVLYDDLSMAQHIVGRIKNFDSRLAKGDKNLVEEIRKGHGVRRKKTKKEIDFYSFATKYCSEHKPDKYPIYDYYVSAMLMEYREGSFGGFTR
jgi:hypothetical protein